MWLAASAELRRRGRPHLGTAVGAALTAVRGDPVAVARAGVRKAVRAMRSWPRRRARVPGGPAVRPLPVHPGIGLSVVTAPPETADGAAVAAAAR
jgi:hypothetical protein